MTQQSSEEPSVALAGIGPGGHSWERVSVAAERYERDLVPALFEPWAEVLLDLADVRAGDRVLDLACGTGVIARNAASRTRPGGHVCGLDVNEDMLAIARRTGGGIDWRMGEASRTGLPEASFDVVLCQQGLQFFPNRLAALREVRRVLVPGGRAVIATWCAADDGDAGYVPIAAALQRHQPEENDPAGFIGAIFSLTDGEEVARLAEAAGFDEVAVQRRTGLVRFPSAEAWVEAFLGAAPVDSMTTLPPATRSAIVADAAAGLRAYVDRAGVAFPLHTNILRCRSTRPLEPSARSSR